MTQMNVEEINTFLQREFPQSDGVVEYVAPQAASMRLGVNDTHLRPGGTVSGPTMMGLADVCLYVAILAQLGPVGMAVTTSLNANFLRKPEPGRDLLAHAKLLKLGKRLAVGEIAIHSEGIEDAVCHVTATYSIPPR